MANRRYTEEEIERGLTELALCGGDRRHAHRRLKLAGHTIPAATLQGWAERTHPERYQQIRADRAPKIAERIANEAEDFALEAAQVELDALHACHAQLTTPPPDHEPGEDLDNYTARLKAWEAKQAQAAQTAGALRNITTSKSLNVDRVASPLRGRPTTIVEHRDFTELAKKLERAQIIEGTAEHMDEEQEAEQTKLLPAG